MSDDDKEYRHDLREFLKARAKLDEKWQKAQAAMRAEDYGSKRYLALQAKDDAAFAEIRELEKKLRAKWTLQGKRIGAGAAGINGFGWAR